MERGMGRLKSYIEAGKLVKDVYNQDNYQIVTKREELEIGKDINMEEAKTATTFANVLGHVGLTGFRFDGLFAADVFGSLEDRESYVRTREDGNYKIRSERLIEDGYLIREFILKERSGSTLELEYVDAINDRSSLDPQTGKPLADAIPQNRKQYSFRYSIGDKRPSPFAN